MKRLAIATLLAALLGGTAPAFAFMCMESSGHSEYSFDYGFRDRYSEQDRNSLDLMRLRQEGVDATSVERWSGCIRAYVRRPGGGQEMQFFEPRSLRRVQ